MSQLEAQEWNRGGLERKVMQFLTFFYCMHRLSYFTFIVMMSLMALYETTSFHVAARLTTKKTTHGKNNNSITTTAGFITNLYFHPQISLGYWRRVETNNNHSKTGAEIPWKDFRRFLGT